MEGIQNSNSINDKFNKPMEKNMADQIPPEVEKQKIQKNELSTEQISISSNEPLTTRNLLNQVPIASSNGTIMSKILRKMSTISLFPRKPQSEFSFEKGINGHIDKSVLTQKLKDHLKKKELSFEDIKALIQAGAEKHGFWNLNSLRIHELAERMLEDVEVQISIEDERRKKSIKKLKTIFLVIFNAISFISALQRKIALKSEMMESSQRNKENLNESSRTKKPFNFQNTMSKPSMIYFYMFLITMATCGVFYYGFNAAKKEKDAYGALEIGMSFAFAGKFSCLFLVNMMFLLMFRDLLTFLRKIALLEKYLVVLFNEHIKLHKFCGFLLVIVSTIHSIGHLGGTFLKIIKVNDLHVLNSVLTYGQFEKLPSYTDLLFRSIPGISGILLLIILYLIYILSFDYFRTRCYQWFLNIHSLYFFFCILLYLHGCMFLFNYGMPYAVYYTSPFFLIGLLHHLKKRLQATCDTPILDVSFSAKNSVAYIKILKPRLFGITPGQYLFLNCPSISSWQWHPFSIFSLGGNGVVKLMIKNSGDFTNHFLSLLFKAKSDYIVGNNIEALSEKKIQELYYDFLLKEKDIYDIVTKKKKGKNIYPKVNIYGPISAPAVGALQNKNVIFIGSGVGISPYLVFLDEYLNFLKGQNNNTGKKSFEIYDREILLSTYRAHRFVTEIRINKEKFQKKRLSNKRKKIQTFFKNFEKICFYYIARDYDQLSWINYYILKLLKYNYDPERFEIKLFLTTSREKINNPENYMFWRSVEKYQDFKEKARIKPTVDFLTNLPHPVTYKRPDFKRLFEGCNEEKNGKDYYVYACGPTALVDSIGDACNQMNKEDENKFIFFPEKF